jgi:uncharacterized protein
MGQGSMQDGPEGGGPRHESWLTPHAEVRDAGGPGLGVFATRDIPAGRVIAGFGGAVIDADGFAALAPERQVHSLQIADELFLVCPEQADPADHVNHSCEPNCGIAGNVLLITMTDVAAGRELTFDYAMCDSDPYDEFECLCGEPTCRRKVTGNDWMIPALQDRYRGRFSTYLEERIQRLRDTPPTTDLV